MSRRQRAKVSPPELDSLQRGTVAVIPPSEFGGPSTELRIQSGHVRTDCSTWRLPLANVAGVLWFDRDTSLLEIDLGIWDLVFKINLKSIVHTARAVVPHLRTAGGGSMVHFSTVQCLCGDGSAQVA
jgi:hypothetical protein